MEYKGDPVILQGMHNDGALENLFWLNYLKCMPQIFADKKREQPF
jgi:hypothetical protein